VFPEVTMREGRGIHQLVMTLLQVLLARSPHLSACSMALPR
jgi:hypothetical protein